MATYVVFAAADDDYVLCTNAVFATARDGTGTLSLGGSTAGSANIGNFLSGAFTCYEYLLNFDTSAIGTETVTTATLSLNIAGIGTTGDELRAAITTSVTPYTTASFIAGASLPTTQATLATPVLNVYGDFTDVGLGAAIAKTGISYLMVYGKKTQVGTAPSGSEIVQPWAADRTGTGQDPKLTIVTVDIRPLQRLDPQRRYS